MKHFTFVVLIMVAACSKSGGGPSSPALSEKESPSQTETNPQTSPPLKEIINETDSVLTTSQKDPRVILVGPSKRDRIIIGNARGYTANMGFCKELESFNEMSRLIDEKRKSIVKTKDLIDQHIKNKAPEHEIETLRFELKYLEKSYERSLRTQSSLESTYLMPGAVVDVEWISGWEENIERLQKENPEYTFVKGTSPSRVEFVMVPRELTYHSVSKMVSRFNETFGIDKLGEGKYSQEEMQTNSYRYSAYATLFSACPLAKKEGNQIEIDVTYSM